MSEGGTRDAIRRIPLLVVYLAILEGLFLVILLAFLGGSGKMDWFRALRLTALLAGIFAVADVAAVLAYGTIARVIASVLYPVDRGSYEGLHEGAQRMLRKGLPAEAVAQYRAWIEAHPKDCEARFEHARIERVALRSPERAIVALTALLDLQPMKSWSVRALEELCDIYLDDLRRPDRAAAMLRVISEYYPDSPEADRAKRRAAALAPPGGAS